MILQETKADYNKPKANKKPRNVSF